MNIHLVDGTYELFRSHFGLPSASAADGMEVAATRGLIRSFLALLRQDDVTHVAIAFDHVIESFRNDLFARYKTGDGIDPGLLAQFPLAEDACRALGLVTWPMVEFEADDAMATAAAKWAEEEPVDTILLCSRDKDLAQCVSGSRVVMLDRMNDQILDEQGVIEKWGVPPASIPDYLALVGDSADGIPGIPRWGAKSSAAMLAAYGTIEAIPPDATDWSIQVRGAKALAENLCNHPQEAALYKRLATLRNDVPLPQTLDDLRWRGAHREQLTALCDRIGEPRIIERVPAFVD
ncbi:MAG: 5'-3' exonuclease H3TH domain-containing protein [Pseudomonadota bacterium]